MADSELFNAQGKRTAQNGLALAGEFKSEVSDTVFEELDFELFESTGAYGTSNVEVSFVAELDGQDLLESKLIDVGL